MKKLIFLFIAFAAMSFTSPIKEIPLSFEVKQQYGFVDLLRTDPPKTCWHCDCNPFYGAYCCYIVPCPKP